MSEGFAYETAVAAEWIDYNGHMRDAFYGLVFSYAVDAFQDAVGLDAAYREASGCTIYLVEQHCFYLAEVKAGDRLDVETRVIGADAKRFHLYQTMRSGGTDRAVCEFMELHVRQAPEPRAADMPAEIARRIMAARLPEPDIAGLRHRSRQMGLKR
ncbi:MAG: thioesterase family protein [Paracoccaceae bacterium]|nr:thioesterase family protein [Paracoccaceae bacterium]